VKPGFHQGQLCLGKTPPIRIAQAPANNSEPDNAVYRTLLEPTRAIPWKIDWASATFAYIGPQIESLLGWKQDRWLSVDDWSARMHPDDRAGVVDYCVAQSQAGVDHEADYRAMTAGGECLQGLQRRLEDFSFRDGLTGVPNRRKFDAVLDEEWDSARRHAQPLSLILIDIDYFKQDNDHYGHVQGDECLKRVGSAFAAATNRPRDLLARYGGEEFALVCCRPPTTCQPGASPNAAARRSSRRRSRTRVRRWAACSRSARALARSSRRRRRRRSSSSTPSTAGSIAPSRLGAIAAWPGQDERGEAVKEGGHRPLRRGKAAWKLATLGPRCHMNRIQ
jgi:GGDEF domain-containing protein